MFASVAFALLASAAATAPFHAGNGEIIPGEYIVMFHKTSTLAQRDAHMAKTEGLVAAAAGAAEIKSRWSFQTFHAYSATLNADLIAAIREDDSVVAHVEQQQVYRANAPTKTETLFAADKKPDVCQVQTGTTWGLVRIAEEELRIDGVYNYDDTKLARGVTAYIIDTGVYVQHSDFERRARGGVSFIAGEPADTDGNGHGTHVAGTTAGTKWGIAKDAEIVGVKVLSQFGSGSTDGVISGIQWTCTDHTRDNNKCVSNLSLGGGLSPAMNAAIDALYDCGCSVVCASGNNGRDACMGSPGAADYCYTVNAMDNQDNHASFSNYGQCTQIYAPGVGITSAWIGAPDSDNTISGTSMAAPHVCGIMAKLAQEDASPASVYERMSATANMNRVNNIPDPTNTINALAHSADMCGNK